MNLIMHTDKKIHMNFSYHKKNILKFISILRQTCMEN